MRLWSRVLALALLLQATSPGYVPACDMMAKAAKAHGCPGCHQIAKVPSCHAGAVAAAKNLPRKACCFLGVLMPCADGALRAVQVSAPAANATLLALAVAAPAWESPTATLSVVMPPGIADLATGPPRSTVLLI